MEGDLEVEGLGTLSGEVLPLTDSPTDSIGDGRRDLLDVDGDGLPDVFETDPTNPSPLGDDPPRSRKAAVGLPETPGISDP